MKLLILGASGQLGCEWQAYLKTFRDKAFTAIPYTSDELDISQYEQVKHALHKHQPDAVINCAAYTNVDEAEEKRGLARSINSEAVKSMSAMCRERDIKLVHFSTDYIFAGQKEDQSLFPEGYPEDHPADPVNWYGQTKWEGEQAIRVSGCRHLIMRASWLCGAFGANFVRTMLRLAEDHGEVNVVDDQMGSPAFARDLVKSTLALIEEEQEGTYHQTSRGIISWADFAEGIFELAGKQVKVNRISSDAYPTKAVRPFYSKLSTKKIEQLPGIEMKDWKTGLMGLLKQIDEFSAKR
jgi:dTDP-4-dehydrorhamnose reductase